MKIRFFDKITNETITDGYYFVDSDGDVYRNNERYAEKQPSVNFADFADLCLHVGWEVCQECSPVKEEKENHKAFIPMGWGSPALVEEAKKQGWTLWCVTRVKEQNGSYYEFTKGWSGGDPCQIYFRATQANHE